MITAEEFLKKELESCYQSSEGIDKLPSILIEFAKLHVTEFEKSNLTLEEYLKTI